MRWDGEEARGKEIGGQVVGVSEGSEFNVVPLPSTNIHLFGFFARATQTFGLSATRP